MPTSKRPKPTKHPKFVQILVRQRQPALYALDATGQIWRLVETEYQDTWHPVKAERHTPTPLSREQQRELERLGDA